MPLQEKKMRECIAAFVCLALVISAGCSGHDESPEPAPASSAKVAPPNPAPKSLAPTLKELNCWEDGGTTGIVLLQDGKEIPLCFDGRIETKTPCRIFAGATHPTCKEAELLAAGSRREAEILALLHSFLDSKYSKEKQAELLANGSWELPEPEAHAWRMLQAINAWERVVNRNESN
jgi:hypothetical protein